MSRPNGSRTHQGSRGLCEQSALELTAGDVPQELIAKELNVSVTTAWSDLPTALRAFMTRIANEGALKTCHQYHVPCP
jgi:hypothetical protein